MRFVIALLAALGVMLGGVSAPVTVAAVDSGYTLALDQQPSGELNIDIDTDGDTWYLSPVWIGIGIVALIVLIALIVAAARGGGTTIIKE